MKQGFLFMSPVMVRIIFRGEQWIRHVPRFPPAVAVVLEGVFLYAVSPAIELFVEIPSSLITKCWLDRQRPVFRSTVEEVMLVAGLYVAALNCPMHVRVHA